MSDLTFNFDLLFKLVIYILLPTIILVLISRVIIALCTKKIKENNPERYYHITNSWLSVVAILITIVLLVVTIIYVLYFVSAMKEKGLVSTHKMMYYLVFAFPVVPFIFLVYYIVGLVKFRRLNKEEEFSVSNQKEEDSTKTLDSFDQFSGFTNPDISFSNNIPQGLDEKESEKEPKDEEKEKKNIELL